MFAGVHDNSWNGFAIFVPAMALVVLTWWMASPFTIRHARVVQKVGAIKDVAVQLQLMVGPEQPIGGEGHFTIFLAERHHAEVE